VSDWIEAERILKYLKGTAEMILVYEARGKRLVGYSDASLGRTDVEGKSTTGCLIKLYGDAVAWKTEKQRNVATSSMELEYVAMSRTAKLLMRIDILKERLLKDKNKLTLMCDNKAAISAAKTEIFKIPNASREVRFSFHKKCL